MRVTVTDDGHSKQRNMKMDSKDKCLNFVLELSRGFELESSRLHSFKTTVTQQLNISNFAEDQLNVGLEAKLFGNAASFSSSD